MVLRMKQKQLLVVDIRRPEKFAFSMVFWGYRLNRVIGLAVNYVILMRPCMTRHEPEVRKICGGITAKGSSPPYAQILALPLNSVAYSCTVDKSNLPNLYHTQRVKSNLSIFRQIFDLSIELEQTSLSGQLKPHRSTTRISALYPSELTICYQPATNGTVK